MACITGFTTGGYYIYTGCCGNIETGFATGIEPVCIDAAFSAGTVGLILDPASTCTENCSQGPFGYVFTLTGVCDTVTGGVTFFPQGAIPPYTIYPVTPIGSGLSAQTSSGEITFTGLTGGTYVFRLNDSTSSQNTELYINVNVTGCFESEIFGTSGTTCGNNNGTFFVTGTSNNPPYTLILYSGGSFVSTTNTITLPYQYGNLTPGIYDVLVYDAGLSTARTQNVVISASTPIDYGFWVIDAGTCVIDGGKIAVTGVTGVGPYTYTWQDSNGNALSQSGQLITGLTAGNYTATVTDYYGCQLTKVASVGNANALSLLGVVPTPPSCFVSDGSIQITMAGGVLPYFYSANTGYVNTTFSPTFTVPNIPAGNYNIVVKDANFCETTVNTTLNSVNSFNVVSNNITNTQCNQLGSIQTQITGLIGFYQYTLSGLTTGLNFTNFTQDQNNTFNNLLADTYLLTISGESSGCFYSENLIVDNQDKFSVNVGVTGATFGSPNGKAEITVGSGYTGQIEFSLNGSSQTGFLNTSAFTYTNLVPGSYIVSVTDSDNCTITRTFNIGQGGGLNSVIFTNNCILGNDGSASILIFDGEPTFTYTWSDNVPLGTTGSTAINLSGGSYSVLVTDSSGCTNDLQFNIVCSSNNVSGTTLYSICDSEFTTTTATKRGVSQMFFEGFLDLTTGYTNCVINSAILDCEIIINGSAYTQTFANITSIDQIPNDNLWIESIDFLLSLVDEIEEYEVNLLNNTISITSKCNGNQSALGNADFSLYFDIEYDISCENIVPTPTPTATPTPTPTPTATPTPTPTATPTPTPTPTATPTPTPTPTATPTPTPTPTPIPISAFRTTVDTRLTYNVTDSCGGGNFTSSASNVITLPFSSSFGLYSNGVINWGDGTTSTLSYGNRVHTYPPPGGVYQITITVNSGGSFTGFGFQNNKDRLKFLSLDEWGDLDLTLSPGRNTFYGFNRMTFSATTDTPTLYNGTSSTDISDLFYYTFTGATSINNIGSWDVRDVFALNQFLDNCGITTSALNTTNYNSLLIGWASYGSSLQNGVVANFGSSKYGPSAAASRSYLTGTKGWVITDGGPV